MIYTTFIICMIFIAPVSFYIVTSHEIHNGNCAPDDKICMAPIYGQITTRNSSHVTLNEPIARRDVYNCLLDITKPKFADGEPQKFQRVSNRNVFVFSAIYDPRLGVGGPMIRVVAAGWQEEYREVGVMYCYLFYENNTAPDVVVANYERILHSPLHPEMYVSHFIKCSLPQGADHLPYAVSIVPTNCSQPENHLLVIGTGTSDPTNTHVLCWPTVYNNFNQWKLALEMIELYRLLGIDHIVVYNHTMGSDMARVLNHYHQSEPDFFSIVQWPFPRQYLSNILVQRGTLNDCIYRMASRHKYVVLHDMDEVLVPKAAESYKLLTNQLDDNIRGAFIFQHAYFRRNSTGEKPYLITQQSLWTTDIVTPPGLIRSKTIYVARKVLKVDLHHAYSLVPDATEYILPPQMGVLHHYRAHPMEMFVKHPERYHYIENKYMHRYGDRLRKAVTGKVKEIGGLHYN